MRRAVIQQDPTGCGIAAVAAIAGVSYREANIAAASAGICVTDTRLWSGTEYVRRLLVRFGWRPAPSTRPFTSWSSLPDCALLAIKWHVVRGRPSWHWVVFVRESGLSSVLDSKQSLKLHARTDFYRIKPKWSFAVKNRRGNN